MSNEKRKRAAELDRTYAQRADEFTAISDQLLKNLGPVSVGLEYAEKVNEESSHVLCDATLLNELGLALLKIVQGADARTVFRQTGRNRAKSGVKSKGHHGRQE